MTISQQSYSRCTMCMVMDIVSLMGQSGPGGNLFQINTRRKCTTVDIMLRNAIQIRLGSNMKCNFCLK